MIRLHTFAIALLSGALTPSGEMRQAPGRPADLNTLIRLIAGSDDPALQRDLLRGTLDAVGGRRRMPMPSAWRESYATLAKSADAEVRGATTRLALIFGDPAAFSAMRKLAGDSSAPTSSRIEAIEALAQARDDGLAPVLQGLLPDPAVRGAAVRGLAATDHEETPALILKAYPSLTVSEKADAIGTLAARPRSALALLAAIGGGSLTKSDVPASSLQALAGHTDSRVKAELARIFGSIRPSSSEKRKTIDRLKAELTPDNVARGDRPHGRTLFARTCASCHQLFDSGGKIGPELTGSQRTNLDYVLSNVVDPSAVVANEYKVSVFATTDGRVVSGIVRREDERSVAVQTANELILIPLSEIEARRTTSESLMPEGLLNGLGKDDVRDLVAYLISPSQVPLPAENKADRGAR
jgi:putative heme-binding domain-containing protein